MIVIVDGDCGGGDVWRGGDCGGEVVIVWRGGDCVWW